eukprot:TRINITY_DN15265_c0_g1_i1.p1 TRINITY_DN15265_c0_g1~~TRINITY_DN15265_c0_g1_i1.p1  ORF type:complete len:117 (-),score=23.98 TRINITY_DN15265_c0_g1_i1:35-385(-)
MDTTGHLLGYVVYILSKQPEYLTRIKNEAIANGINFDRITIDDLASLKYLDAFLKEALRFCSPAPYLFPRMATATHKLGDITILKGTIVNVGSNIIGFPHVPVSYTHLTLPTIYSV